MADGRKKSGLLLGAASEIRDWLEERLDELIEIGEKRAREWKQKKLSAEEKKSFLETDQPRGKIRAFFRSFGLVSHEDLKEIKERLDDLEVLMERKGLLTKSVRRKRGRKKRAR